MTLILRQQLIKKNTPDTKEKYESVIFVDSPISPVMIDCDTK